MSAFNEMNNLGENTTNGAVVQSISKRMATLSANDCTDSYGGDCLNKCESTPTPQPPVQPILMPVSELQELCAKNGLKNPEYRLCRTEGNPHSPLFTYQVLLNDVVIGEGMAKSKKSAKHSAAQKALSKIKAQHLMLAQNDMTNDFNNKLRLDETDNCDSSAEALDRSELAIITAIKAEPNEQNSSASAQVNGVSILNELCAKNGLQLPVYDLQDRMGACHEPVFWFSCQITVGTETIVGKASAKTKQLAKRSAAEEVLKILQQKDIPLSTNNNKKKSRHYSHQNDPNIDQQRESRECLEFMESLHQNQDLDKLIESNDTDFCLRLNLIAEKLNCLANYITLQEEQSKTNKFKCLLQLSRNNSPLCRRLPLFVSWGNSPVSTDQAMQKAAQKAVIMIKVLKM